MHLQVQACESCCSCTACPGAAEHFQRSTEVSVCAVDGAAVLASVDVSSIEIDGSITGAVVFAVGVAAVEAGVDVTVGCQDSQGDEPEKSRNQIGSQSDRRVVGGEVDEGRQRQQDQERQGGNDDGGDVTSLELYKESSVGQIHFAIFWMTVRTPVFL